MSADPNYMEMLPDSLCKTFLYFLCGALTAQGHMDPESLDDPKILREVVTESLNAMRKE